MSRELTEILPSYALDAFQGYYAHVVKKYKKEGFLSLVEKPLEAKDHPLTTKGRFPGVLGIVAEYYDLMLPPVYTAIMQGEALVDLLQNQMPDKVQAVYQLLCQSTDEELIGANIFFWAKERNDVVLLECLGQLGLDIDKSNEYGDSLLMTAIRRGDLARVKALLAAGASPSKYVTARGASCLHLAAGTGRLEILEAILPSFPDVNIRDDFGETPLHYAAGRGVPNVWVCLLRKGANKLLRDDRGDTALNTMVDDNGNPGSNLSDPKKSLTYPGWQDEYEPMRQEGQRFPRSKFVRKEAKRHLREEKTPLCEEAEIGAGPDDRGIERQVSSEATTPLPIASKAPVQVPTEDIKTSYLALARSLSAPSKRSTSKSKAESKYQPGLWGVPESSAVSGKPDSKSLSEDAATHPASTPDKLQRSQSMPVSIRRLSAEPLFAPSVIKV